MNICTRALGICALLISIPCLAQDDKRAAESETTSTIPVESEKKTDSESPERDDESVTYSGIGLSRVSTDFDNLKEAVNLDIVLGIRVPNLEWISAEVNLGFSIIPGENRGGTSIVGGGSGNCTVDDPPTPPGCMPASEGQQISQSGEDFQMQGIGAYLALKSPGRFYATGKVGYGYQITTIREIDDRERSGTVYAAGAGWRYGKGPGGVELLYTRLLSEIDTIGFNVSYGFGGDRRRRDRDRDRD